MSTHYAVSPLKAALYKTARFSLEAKEELSYVRGYDYVGVKYYGEIYDATTGKMMNSYRAYEGIAEQSPFIGHYFEAAFTDFVL